MSAAEPIWTDGTTTVYYSGWTWRTGRQERHPVTDLMEMFRDHVLDRRFATETYREHRADEDQPAVWHGNFFTYSYVFRIETADPGVAAWIEYAIRCNCQRPEWWEQAETVDPTIGKLYDENDALRREVAELRTEREELRRRVEKVSASATGLGTLKSAVLEESEWRLIAAALVEKRAGMERAYAKGEASASETQERMAASQQVLDVVWAAVKVPLETSVRS